MAGMAGYTFKTKKMTNLECRKQRSLCIFNVYTPCATVSTPLTIFYRYPGGLHSVQSAFSACWAWFSARRRSSLVDKVAGHQQQSGNSSQRGRIHDQHSKRALETTNKSVKISKSAFIRSSRTQQCLFWNAAVHNSDKDVGYPDLITQELQTMNLC